ncbi:unnamed protein product [Ectocarpus sp. CCAP 1310/34]|nr:unnamed protein product [Ectocarpus sp. CCAP 1310/34]
MTWRNQCALRPRQMRLDVEFFSTPAAATEFRSRCTAADTCRDGNMGARLDLLSPALIPGSQKIARKFCRGRPSSRSSTPVDAKYCQNPAALVLAGRRP